MAAGLGFKTFTTGEVLTAADTNGYLMQGVLVFASSAARASAITSPQEGQYSYLKDTNSTEYYDGAAWIAAPIGDITGVTAGTGISGGGTSGTVTITNSMATEITAKGDLIAGTGSATFDNLPVGTNGQTLVADSTASTGLKWAAAASSGLTLIKRATTTGAATTGTTFDGMFTSTYKAYKIVIESWISATSADDPLFQLRYAGPTTENSANYFGSNGVLGRDNVWIYNPSVGTTALIMSESVGDAWGSHYEMTITQVGNASEKPSAFYLGNRQGNQSTIIGTLYHDVARTYTGFILSTASNLTVTVAVYGLATV